MEFNNFKKELLNSLITNKTKKCLELIENNKELIKENLGDNGNLQTIKNFVDELNDTIVKNGNNNSNFITIVVDKDNKYKLYEKVLKHPYFSRVYIEFKNSNILLRSCKTGNKTASKWLLTMDISPYLQDENGMTALMYAAIKNFDFVITPYLHDSHCLNLEDRNGYNVLFHAISSFKHNDEYELGEYIYKLVQSDIDINHPNNKGETALIFSIKKNLFLIIK